MNIRVKEKKPLDEIEASRVSIREADEALNGNGRVVVRYSGTEPLARVMIEAESEEAMRRHADAIAGAISRSTRSLTQQRLQAPKVLWTERPYFKSRQFAPTPTSATSGTFNSMTRSISDLH